VLKGMRSALLDMAHDHGAAVSLIGWSMGGIYAWRLAREKPRRGT